MLQKSYFPCGRRASTYFVSLESISQRPIADVGQPNFPQSILPNAPDDDVESKLADRRFLWLPHLRFSWTRTPNQSVIIGTTSDGRIFCVALRNLFSVSCGHSSDSWTSDVPGIYVPQCMWYPEVGIYRLTKTVGGQYANRFWGSRDIKSCVTSTDACRASLVRFSYSIGVWVVRYADVRAEGTKWKSSRPLSPIKNCTGQKSMALVRPQTRS